MPKIGDIEFSMEDLTDKGRLMAQDYFYSKRRALELQGEIRIIAIAQSEILKGLKQEFKQNNPFT